jgi:hypothetical protein
MRWHESGKYGAHGTGKVIKQLSWNGCYHGQQALESRAPIDNGHGEAWGRTAPCSIINAISMRKKEIASCKKIRQ